MSRVVDERIAEMRFDNKDFEENVAQSMSTLDKLKNALNFGNAGKAFDDITKAAEGVSFGGIGEAIDNVSSKFSALEIAGITALMNITNKAVDAGAQMVKSLTIDQITTGFSKYADKTTAVQTIMSATKQDFEDEAEQMEYVNEQLEKLNWFTDETSYNFVDMVSNIGKFTNAGINLEDAVTSMQGVATWAAISGANAQQASRAMYNLAQATGVGYMQLIDWKSIENANMATLEFKEMAIQTGVAMGTLKKVGDQIVAVSNGAEVTAQNFASTLSSSKWFTTDVLNSVLNMYGGFTNILNEAYNETGMETFSLLSYTEDYANGLLDLQKIEEETGISSERLKEIFEQLSDPTYDLGRRAFRAAQETKTFAEVIDYTKDAVSSGWMTTFEIIFGDYKEAKEMWSDLTEVFYELFVKSGEARNNILRTWKELGGRTSMLEAISNAYGAIVKVVETVKDAFHDVFPVKSWKERGQALYDFTEKVRVFTEKLMMSEQTAEKLKGAVTPIFVFLKNMVGALKTVGLYMKNFIIPAFGGFLGSAKEIISPLGKVLTLFKEMISFVFEPLMKVPGNIFHSFAVGLKMMSEDSGAVTTKIVEWLNGFQKTISESENLKNVLGTVRKVMFDIAGAFQSFFSLSRIYRTFQSAGGGISGILAVIKYELKVIWDTIVDIINDITGIDISEGVIGKVADGISSALGKIKDAFNNLRGVDTSGVDKIRQDTEEKLGPIATIFNGLKKVFSGIWSFLGKLSPLFSAAGSAIGSALGLIGEKISKIDPSKILGLMNGGILVGLGLGIKKLIDWIKNLKEDKGTIFGLLNDIKEKLGSITDVLDSARGALESWQQNLKAGTLLKIAAAVGVITASILVLSEIDPDKLGTALAAVTVEFTELMASMQVFSKITAKIDTRSMKAAGFVMIELSVAVLILSAAVKSLSSLSWEELAKGLVGVGALCTELALTLKNLNLGKLGISKGLGLILFATSIRILSSSVKSLSELGWEELLKGLLGVGALLTGLSLFMNNTKVFKMGVLKAAAIVIFAASLKVLASAVKQMSELKWEELAKGLVGVGALLVALSLFMNSTKTFKMGVLKATGILIFVASLKVLASVVKQMSELKWEEMLKGLVGISALMLELVAFMGLMKAMGTSGVNMIAVSLGILILGSALEVISDVMAKFGGMKWEEIARGLVMLAGSLVIISVAMNLMKGTIGGALALLIVSASLQVLNGVLQSFASMTWGEILKSMVGLAGVFVIVGAAGLVLAPIVPIILLLGVALLTLGTGIGLISASLALFAASLTIFNVVTTAGIATMVFALKSFLLGIVEFVGEAAFTIAEAIVKVIKAFFLMFREIIPDFVETVVMIIDGVLKSLAEHGPSIVNSVVALIELLLDVLIRILPEFNLFVLNAIIGLLELLAEKQAPLIQAGIDLIISLIDGLSEGLVNNAPRIRDSLWNFADSLLGTVLTFFGIDKLAKGSESSKFTDIGKALIDGLIGGIKKKINDAVEAVKNFGNKILGKVKDLFGINSPSKVFEGFGINLGEGLSLGIGDSEGGVIDAIKGFVSNIVETADDETDKAKIDLSSVFNIKPDIELPDFSGFTDSLDLSSLADNEDILSSFGDSIGSIDTASIMPTFESEDILSDFGNVVGEIEDTPINPEITPVLNLADFTATLNKVPEDYQMSANLGISEATQSNVNGFVEIQNEIRAMSRDVTDYLARFREDFTYIINNTSKIKVVMDTGALVGTLVVPMDKALGERAILAERGL